VSPGAYLLFYRRRTDRALGNPELRKLVESYQNSPESDSESSAGSCSPRRSQSPSSDGGRARAGKAPRVSRGQDSLGNDLYSSAEESTEGSEDGGSEGKRTDFEHESRRSHADSLSMLTEPSWSFDDAHADLQMASPDAATDGNLGGRRSWGEPMNVDPPFQYELTGGEDEDSSDELPVVELRVGSEDNMSLDQ
jgi:ubiquitin carboxyl-terminal hydrolase 4/11/15